MELCVNGAVKQASGARLVADSKHGEADVSDPHSVQASHYGTRVTRDKPY